MHWIFQPINTILLCHINRSQRKVNGISSGFEIIHIQSYHDLPCYCLCNVRLCSSNCMVPHQFLPIGAFTWSCLSCHRWQVWWECEEFQRDDETDLYSSVWFFFPNFVSNNHKACNFRQCEKEEVIVTVVFFLSTVSLDKPSKDANAEYGYKVILV